jgi:hypothetical protein
LQVKAQAARVDWGGMALVGFAQQGSGMAQESRVRTRDSVVAVLRVFCVIAALAALSVSVLAGESPGVDVGRTEAAVDRLPDAPGFGDAVSGRDAQLALKANDVVQAAGLGMASVVVADTPQRKMKQRELDGACQSGELRGKPCKLVWLPMLWEMFEETAAENGGNIALDTETRNDLVTNPYWATYIKCVHQYRYRQWSDDTPFIVHDIGHPMQGAMVYSIYEQNDPKSRGLGFVNDGNYWRAHLKAMAVVALFEVQWKIGPASEAAIGNSGLNTYFTPRVVGRSTNETGFQDFVITPVYGLGWNITEDLVDKYVMPHIWKHTHNKLILTALLPLTPCRAAANFFRYKPLYYRDYPLTPLR